MRLRWTMAWWPILGIALGFAVSSWSDARPAQAGPSWDVPGKRWVTESSDGLLFWQHLPSGSMQATEHYLAEYVVPSDDKDAAPQVKMGVFRRVFDPVPPKVEPLRRYGEVLQQKQAPYAPPPMPAPTAPSCGGSCGGGSCG